MNELRRSAAVVAAALLVSVALWRVHAQPSPGRPPAPAVTWAPASADPPPGYHYVVGADQLRRHLSGRGFYYGARQQHMARLVSWRRARTTRLIEWWPKYRLSRNCRWISSPDPHTVCESIGVIRSAGTTTRRWTPLWDWSTGGPVLPGMSPTYAWGNLFRWIGGSAGSMYRHVTRPCRAGWRSGFAGGVVLPGLASSMADDAAVVGSAVVEAAGGPVAAGIEVDGCVVAVIQKNL